jgi:hypothetical protein
VLFLSLSSSKLPTYILPILPALALSAACGAAGCPPRRLRLQVIAATAVAVLAPVAVLWAGTREYGWPPSLKAADLLWPAAAAAIAWLMLTGTALRRLSACAALLALAFHGVYSLAARNESLMHPHAPSRTLSRAIRPALRDGDRVVLLNRYPLGLSFDLRRPITFPTYKFRIDLAADRERLKETSFDDPLEAYRWFDSTQRVFVLLSEKALVDMKKAIRTPPREVYRDARTIVVANQ